ncbi:MAG: acyl-CoA dehydrogenase family protein, partial [Alphaproteobacteria bacterium]
MQLTPQHEELRRSLIRFIDTEINPNVDKWEDNPPFPAHEVFRKMGKAGFLGITKPEKFGGLGLDYSFAAVYCEALGHIDCGAIPMAIAVQTEMATPALARFGSDEVREEFLRPSITGDYVAGLTVTSGGLNGTDAVTVTAIVPVNHSPVAVADFGQVTWWT